LDGTEDGIDDGSPGSDGIEEGKVDGSLDSDGPANGTNDGSLDIKHGIDDGSLTFDGTEDGIDDGSLDLVGINAGNFDSSLDSDGTDNGSLDFDATADGNVEGLLDFDGTEDGIVIAVFDKKTRRSSEPSSILKLETEPPAELLPKGTGHHQNLRKRLLTHQSSQMFLLSLVWVLLTSCSIGRLTQETVSVVRNVAWVPMSFPSSLFLVISCLPPSLRLVRPNGH
jgi:hypothetical protein